MRPLLAPGLHVLRRGDGHLQLGLDPAHAVVLPDTADVRRDLDRLLRGDALSEEEVPLPVRPLLRRAPARPRGTVAVERFGHPAGEPMVGRLRGLADASGLGRARTAATVAVLAGVGEPARDLVDRWSRQGTAHLLVRLVEGRAEIGPFVVPGVTACLRCLDAATADDDPAWPLLVEQYVAASARDRRDGTAEPVDPALAELACAWAVRDVASYLQGHRPSSWSATIRLDPLLRDLQTTAWPRHPECGCAWRMDV